MHWRTGHITAHGRKYYYTRVKEREMISRARKSEKPLRLLSDCQKADQNVRSMFQLREAHKEWLKASPCAADMTSL